MFTSETGGSNADQAGAKNFCSAICAQTHASSSLALARRGLRATRRIVHRGMSATVTVERVDVVIDAFGEQRQAHSTPADLAGTESQPCSCMPCSDRLEQSGNEPGEAQQEGLLTWVHRERHGRCGRAFGLRVPAERPGFPRARLLTCARHLACTCLLARVRLPAPARLFNGSSAPTR